MNKYLLIFFINLIVSYNLKAQSVWSVLNSTVAVDLLKVQCLSDDTLFLFGDNGILLRSTDGGNNFTIKQNITASIYTTGHFINTDTGFAASGTGYLKRTYDGGNNWSIVYGCQCFISDVCFSNKSIGVMCDIGGIYCTDNGGSNWAIVANNSSKKIVAVEDSVFFSIFHNYVFRIADAGLSHTSQVVNTLSSAYLSGISFIDSHHGYTVSSDGYIYRTIDQGLNWMPVNSNTILDVSDIDFVDSLHGFMIAGGLRNTIYKSIDGGHNWMLDYVASDPIESITHCNGSVYACGQNGLVLKKQVSLVGIEETAKKSLSIQLSPSNDLVLIASADDFAEKPFRIFNVTGQLMINGKFLPGQNEINISMVQSGNYILEVEGFEGLKFNVTRN